MPWVDLLIWPGCDFAASQSGAAAAPTSADKQGAGPIYFFSRSGFGNRSQTPDQFTRVFTLELSFPANSRSSRLLA
jgi:hypothetical protein